jgi:phosphoheptose isomerase
MGYVKSLTDTLNSVQCEVDTGYARIDRGVDAAATLIKTSQERGGSVWLLGNGGSGTIADHIACDMVKMRGWRAFALTNPALTTTMANDIEYSRAFAAQLAVLSSDGDVVIGMSCSGNSRNVCSVMGQHANPRQGRIILTGFEANNVLRALMPNVNFYVPSNSYAEVQIAHLMILHAIVDLADGVP